jgi:hypothetical protein
VHCLRASTCAMSSWLWLLCMVATVWMSFILVSLDIIRRR